MVKIEVHKYNRAYMAPLGVHSYKLQEPTIEMFDRVCIYIGVIVLTFSLTSTTVYFYQNMHEVKEALESFKIFVGGSQSGVCALAVGFQMRKIKILHMKFQELVDEGEIFLSIKPYFMMSHNRFISCRHFRRSEHTLLEKRAKMPKVHVENSSVCCFPYARVHNRPGLCIQLYAWWGF